MFKVLVYLLLLGFIGLTGYAYLGDMSPVIEEVNEPVILDVE